VTRSGHSVLTAFAPCCSVALLRGLRVEQTIVRSVHGVPGVRSVQEIWASASRVQKALQNDSALMILSITARTGSFPSPVDRTNRRPVR